MLIAMIMLGLPILVLLLSIRIIPQTHKGVVERFGKYSRFCDSGLTFVIPIIESMKYRNITERMTNVRPQDIITKDNLNARVDLVVYHKVKLDEENVKKSYYNVENYKEQIIMLAQTTARNVIGDMKFAEVNNQRNKLNEALATSIDKETSDWGVAIVRVELKEITPPADVQETMNMVIKAQNEKEAAVDFATSVETKADGERRASIKKAEGVKIANILEAEGQAEAIKLVNESAEKYFKGNAKELKQLEVTEKSLKNNSKIIITEKGISPSIIIGNLPVSKEG
uniref:Putative SPFH domain / band 7 protein n=1 Tax=viral metagenome TaxID=1070528 RepID=A0A6M3J5W6_9ZZZZ